MIGWWLLSLEELAEIEADLCGGTCGHRQRPAVVDDHRRRCLGPRGKVFTRWAHDLTGPIVGTHSRLGQGGRSCSTWRRQGAAARRPATAGRVTVPQSWYDCGKPQLSRTHSPLDGPPALGLGGRCLPAPQAAGTLAWPSAPSTSPGGEGWRSRSRRILAPRASGSVGAGRWCARTDGTGTRRGRHGRSRGTPPGAAWRSE